MFSFVFVSFLLNEGDDVGKGLADSESFTLGGEGVVGKHNSDLNTNDTLSETDVSDGGVHVGDSGLSGVDHVSVSELHALGSLLSDLSGDNDFATLGASLEHLSDDVGGGSSDGDTEEKSLLEVLSLLLGVETAVGGLLGEEDELVVGGSVEAVSLLDETFKLLDLDSGLLGGIHQVVELADQHSHFGGGFGEVDFNSAEAEIGKGLAEELVDLGSEDSIGDELSLG